MPWLPASPPCQEDGSGGPSSLREASRQQDRGGSREGTVQAQAGPSVPAGRPEPWGVWHAESPGSFQTQLPGQHCGLLCVSTRSRAPGSRWLGVGAELESQRDNSLEHKCVLWVRCVLGALTGPERQLNPLPFCPGAVCIEHTRSLRGCAGEGGGGAKPIA